MRYTFVTSGGKASGRFGGLAGPVKGVTRAWVKPISFDDATKQGLSWWFIADGKSFQVNTYNGELRGSNVPKEYPQISAESLPSRMDSGRYQEVTVASPALFDAVDENGKPAKAPIEWPAFLEQPA